MKSTFLSYNNIVCNLGFDSKSVVQNIIAGKSGLNSINDKNLLPDTFCAAMVDPDKLKESFVFIGNAAEYTKLEQMMILSLSEVIQRSGLDLNNEVGLIVSTTKGNVQLLDETGHYPHERVYLDVLGEVIRNFFGFTNEAIVLSNACVSGILAISVAKRYISQGRYKHVFIVGGDLISKFVISGFNSFQALSPEPCQPYDKNRKGINLGEAAASILVTSERGNLTKESVEVLGEATCNDANHISGPSRTGEGLYRSIVQAMNEASFSVEDVDFISAHGTATPFNDEMEAIAFNRLGMKEIPLHSLKGYFGHTLGASGLLETIIAMHGLNQHILFPSKGFSDIGTSKSLNIISLCESKEINTFLKTASGFGGCNTAVLFRKTTN